MTHKFLAIDFETANYQSDSACSLGLVRVENGKITAQQHYLIRPPYRDFTFTHIHGISWKHVERAPAFLEVWYGIQGLFQDIDFVAAHNMRFDQKVLTSCCELYKIKLPKLTYTCTVQIAKKNLGINPANLPAVCRALRIPLKHHDALSDAMACAQIVLVNLAKSSATPQANFGF